MPTGYTSKIYEGEEVSGKDFLLICARAFGALITMRDEDMDAPIPEEFKATDYYEKGLKEAQEKLEKYKNMPLDEAETLSLKEFIEREKSRLESLTKDTLLRARYVKTLSEVEKWIPPTEEHRQLKDFAVEQLKGSIDFDCSLNYPPIKKLSAQEWLKEKIDSCLWDIAYHKKEQEKETERISGRNQWINQLRQSLQ
jgi:hypothetical protein